MGRFLTNIDDILNNIKHIDLFDLQIIGMPNDQKMEENNGLIHFLSVFGGFSGSVSNIGFDKNNIYVIYNDFDQSYTLNSIDDDCFNKGIRLILAERDGTLVGKYEFSGCKLISKVPIKLGYDSNYVLRMHPYILVFKYSKIYKII